MNNTYFHKLTVLMFLLSTMAFSTLAQEPSSSLEVLNSDPEYKGGMGAGVNISTWGPGIEVSKTLSPSFNVRLGGNYYASKFISDFGYENFEVDNTITLGKLSLLCDYYPGGQDMIFHLSAGLLYSFTNATFVVASTEATEFGSYTFTPTDIGNLTANISSNKIQPYFGIGLGRAVPKNRVGFMFELGTAYQGAPKIDLLATGMIEPTAEQSDIVAANVEGFVLYPVLNLQLTFKLF